LTFRFISGSPDFGSISFQLFWLSPLPAACWYWLPLLLFPFILSAWDSLVSNAHVHHTQNKIHLVALSIQTVAQVP
jgi:hypothetical protein